MHSDDISDNSRASAARRLARAWRTRSLMNGTVVSGAIVAVVLLNMWTGLSWPAVLATAAAAVALLVAATFLPSSSDEMAPGPGRLDSASRGAPTAGATAWSTILSGIPDPAFVVDGGGGVVAVNSSAIALFPLETGRHLSMAIRSPDLLQAITTALSQHETQHCTVRLMPPREQVLEGRVTPLASDTTTSHQGAILVVLRDTTEQEQLARMRADFVANASHELRTPLTSLKGFVETLQGAAKDDAAARERFLGIMQQQAERMSRLIEDLLSLSRVEMREHVAPSTTVDLAAIVRETARAMKPQADQAGIAVELDSASNEALVPGDRDELTQVVNNLVHNAIKYGRPAGRVGIHLRRENDRLRLDVSDDGIGIAPEHVPRLTERFYRVSAKESRERGGTGLGLAIVKHIVSRHRGQLVIRSEPGVGSTFSVLLPAADKE